MPGGMAPIPPSSQTTMTRTDKVASRSPCRGRPTRQQAAMRQWARLATLMAGNDRGTFFIPNKDDEVLVVFQGGDPSFPFVIGSLWNGKDIASRFRHSSERTPYDPHPRRHHHHARRSQGPGDIHRRTPRATKAGSQQRRSSFSVKDDLGNSIQMTPSGVKITAGAKFEVDCSKAVITAGDLTVNAGTATFSGKVKADTVEANSYRSARATRLARATSCRRMLSHPRSTQRWPRLRILCP